MAVDSSSKTDDDVDGEEKKENFTVFHATLIVVSMITFLLDVSTDVILVASYFSNGYTVWGIITLLFVFLPTVIVHMFSMRWHIMDETVNVFLWIIHIFLLGIVHRYIVMLKTGLEARTSKDPVDFQRLYHQQNDASLLRLFESFLESAPQLVFQLYIMISLEDWHPWTGISAAASMISLVWALAAYTKAARNNHPEKQRMTWRGLCLQGIWRLGMLSARIMSLVIFALQFKAWIFLFVGAHWLGMTTWIIMQKTDFCLTPWEERIYNCIVGLIYCFCFFNLREGQSRHRALAFYLVTVTENIICLMLFFLLSDNYLSKGTEEDSNSKNNTSGISVLVSATVIIIGGTVMGLTSILLYYHFFHPARKAKLCKNDRENIVPLPNHSPSSASDNAGTLRSLKHMYYAREKDHCKYENAGCQEDSPISQDGETDKKSLVGNLMSSYRTSPCFDHSTEEAPALPLDVQETPKVKTHEETPSTQFVERLSSLADQAVNVEVTEQRKDDSDHEGRETEPNGGTCQDGDESSGLFLPSRENQNDELIKQKRRGICPSDPDIELDDLKSDDSAKEAIGLQLTVPDDASEALSAHDYENMCAVNIAREPWGLRSWRGYSDIENSLHDDSLFRDRRRDTLNSTITTLTYTSQSTSQSQSVSTSDYSSGGGLDGSEPAPPLPCRRPCFVQPRTRQDDYIDSLADDLANCESSSEFSQSSSSNYQEVCVNSQQDVQLAEFVFEPTTFVAQPCIVDQNGSFIPLSGRHILDTILEEHEDSLTDSTDTIEKINTSQKSTFKRGSNSTLVATIDEIRNNSLCNLYYSSLSDLSDTFQQDFDPSALLEDACIWEVQSECSLDIQNADGKSGSPTSIQEHAFLDSNQAETKPPITNASPLSYRLTHEEMIFLSKLQTSCSPKEKGSPTDKNVTEEPHTESITETNKSAGKKCKPRRKFSLIREKFEPKKYQRKDTIITLSPSSSETRLLEVTRDSSKSLEHLDATCNQRHVNQVENKISSCEKENIPTIALRINQWNNFLKMQNECNSRIQYRDFSSAGDVSPDHPDAEVKQSKPNFTPMKERRRMFLKQVLTPPKIQNWSCRSSLPANSKVVSAS